MANAVVPPLDHRRRRFLLAALIGTSLLGVGLAAGRDLLSANYLRHMDCYLAQPRLIWTHVLADSLIGAAYVAISATLAVLVIRRGDRIPFQWVFVSFGGFIVACGLSHLVEVVTIWRPYYWLLASIKVVTAVASVTTAVTLPRVLPRANRLLDEAAASDERKQRLECIKEVLEEQLETKSHNVQELAREITLRNRQLEAVNRALARSEQRYRAAFDLAAVGVTEVSLDGHWIRVNDRFCAITGYDRQELAARTFMDITHPEDIASDREGCESMIAGLIGDYSREKRYVHKDGHEVWVHLTVSLVRGETDRSPKYFIAIVQDISTQKQAEAALMQSEKLAAAGRLAASVAHEINNPLEAITNLLFLVQSDSELSRGTRGFVDSAQREVQRVGEIAQQTLKFYRQSTKAAPASMRQLCDSVLSLFEPRLLQRRIRVVREHQDVTPLLCYGNEMRQVLANLVCNAIDAMPNGGTLRIRSSEGLDPKTSRRGVRITLADSGCGIPMAAAKRIFEPFYTTKLGNGTGLGLWVTRQLIYKHEGQLHVRSSVRPGHSGTVFSVFLPHEQGTYEIAAAA